MTCPTCGQPTARTLAPPTPTAGPYPRLKVLRSVHETEHLPPHERIAEIMDFLSRQDRAKAERMIAGLEQHEARRVLDQAIMDEKL